MGVWPVFLELAIGDAYGAGFEYAPPEFVRRGNTLRGYARHPKHRDVLPGMYTDDTQMSLAVAEWLLGGTLTRDDLAERFVAAYRRDPRAGYASGFRSVLERVRSGPELLDTLRPGSDKSGAAMRAGVLGLLPDIDEVRRLTTLQARITHDSPGGIAAALGAAYAVHYCRHGLGPVSGLPAWLAERVPAPASYGRWDESWRGTVGSPGMHSVRAAVTALARNREAGELLRDCVAFTGDVDTVATVALAAASVSGAYARDLPEALVDGLESGAYGRAYLLGLDERLAARWGLADTTAEAPGPEGRPISSESDRT
ncbi:ADP-ribosylglycohydrolase family protein [Yinghuangia sp. ASG 101]|uniref:ADP-ribosylglycohydrolase family protein n=1 Tax=Yinghuangia sp. ASG 101 TaxID=2896848 RepID=UPI001E36EF67|nr:ADP-ribosylglycohydrolase family protein [Yinghuangia sp. ASG 101]UGQ13300.1 ADP-ribosylglycohydrolase family protein [Yinghuangia sp. ASG 101]